jgi:hypothetical protein
LCRNGAARSLAWFALLVFASVQAASCRELVGGENLNAAQTLCEQLNACFGENDPSIPSCEILEGRMKRATETERAEGLANFESAGCLEANCGLARACLDLDGFCVGPAKSCVRDVDCCNWSVGLTECGPKADGSMACCSSSGIECVEDADCCGSEQCLTLVGDVKTCGGVKCNALGEACASSAQCCGSLNCFQGECQVRNCIEQDGPCKSDEDCCTQTVPGEMGSIEVPLFCVEGRCGPKAEDCYDETSACDAAKPCCNEEATCQLVATGLSRCSTCTGAGEGVDCSQNSDCCSSSCVPIGEQLACAKPGCEAVGGACSFPTDCCTGVCDGSSSTCADAYCIAAECHDPCEVGPPLQGCGVGEEDVVGAIPSCGCYWAVECVVEYEIALPGACN